MNEKNLIPAEEAAIKPKRRLSDIILIIVAAELLVIIILLAANLICSLSSGNDRHMRPDDTPGMMQDFKNTPPDQSREDSKHDKKDRHSDSEDQPMPPIMNNQMGAMQDNNKPSSGNNRPSNNNNAPSSGNNGPANNNNAPSSNNNMPQS